MNRNGKQIKLVIGLIILALASLLLYWGCSPLAHSNGGVQKKMTVIVFADAEWASIQIHNRIAGYIIGHGYGYQPRYLAGETIPLFTALQQGDVDIMMEVWTSDYPALWEKMTKSGKIKALSNNYSGIQGWVIPTYMVEGDTERGIEPQIPTLKSVPDLPAYQKYFRTSAISSKGIIYNAPPEWPAKSINIEKFKNYRLSAAYSLLPGDSEAALDKSLDKAYKRGEAWLGYARDPSLISAGHKLTILQEEAFTEERWNLDHTCAYPECNVAIAANSGMNQKAPEILDFLQKYKTTRKQNEDMLIYLKNFAGNSDKAAREWLLNNPDVWGQWVPEETAEKIWTDLNPPAAASGKTSFLSKLFKKK